VVDAIAVSNGQEDTRVVYLIPSDIAAQYVRQSGATSGGAFMTAWTKAITEYDATAPCHFTNAKRDLTSLKSSYPAFGGVNSYLTDAQSKATAAECPTPGPSAGLIVGICGGLLVLLAILGALVFMLVRRSRQSQPQPAMAANYGATPNVYGQPTPPGAYPQSPQPGTPFAPTFPGGAAPYGAPPVATPQPQAYPPPQQQVYGTPPATTQPPAPQPQQPVQPASATRLCANGHAVNDPTAQYCPVCGAPVQ